MTEGSLYRFGQLSFDGNKEFEEAELYAVCPLNQAPFKVKTAQQAQQTLQDLYRKTGYNDVAIQYSQAKDADKKSST